MPFKMPDERGFDTIHDLFSFDTVSQYFRHVPGNQVLVTAFLKGSYHIKETEPKNKDDIFTVTHNDCVLTHFWQAWARLKTLPEEERGKRRDSNMHICLHPSG